MQNTSSIRTLVLNAGFEPLSVISFKRALVLVMTEKASVIEHVEGDPIKAASGEFERPAVIVLTRYVRMPHSRRIPVTRRGVLRRDGHRCAYCGKAATTIDHVFPRSRGGQETWENLVACCLGCNNAKANRTPSEMGWQLPKEPKAPHGGTWTVRGADRQEPQWEQYLPVAA